ncbi:MAG: MaoC family dehydratase N-terminal domain-containing protein [Chloroflexi bacterium]|nr:MaoC family dehydratase N-terminal domain-containing protein [Chloroflexota bacterium]
MSQQLVEDLKTLIGQEGEPREALDEVCKPMIRHWCAAMQDGNPLYTNEEYAKTSRYGNIIAPPTMMLTYTMPPLWPPKEDPPHHFEQFLEKLDKAGYLGILVTNVSQKYYKPLFVGDRITFTYKVTDMSPEKKTSLGAGYFVTTSFIFTNQKGETVGTQSFTVLKYSIG